MKISLNEIFLSINGETTYQGLPTTFVRFAGCSIGCKFCDTRYSWDIKAGKPYTITQAFQEIKKLGCKRICLTGGEPLMQQEGLLALVTRLFHWSDQILIETSGAYPIPSSPDPVTNPWAGVIWSCDVKTPSVQASKPFLKENLNVLGFMDMAKVLAKNTADLQWARDLIVPQERKNGFDVLVQPLWDLEGQQKQLQSFVKFILNNKLWRWRLQYQMHKLIWPVNQRGV